MSKEENLECSFCGRKKAETELLIAGMDAHICDKCIEQNGSKVIYFLFFISTGEKL